MTPGLRRVFEEHRDERAQELYEIANLLDKQALTTDSGPIRRAAFQCKGGFKSDGQRQYWGFEIAELQIKLGDQRHGRPQSAIMQDCIGALSVKVEEYVPNDQDSVGHSFELLREATVDFHFDAYHEIGGEIFPLRAAWHLDTHAYSNQADRGVHPRFHFQVGGDRLAEIDSDIRGVLMSDSPRLPCAPLDGILAVDFVLSNYCGKKWNELKDNLPGYLRLRKSPIQRYWFPYFRMIADSIEKLDSVPGGGEGYLLLPNISCG